VKNIEKIASVRRLIEEIWLNHKARAYLILSIELLILPQICYITSDDGLVLFTWLLLPSLRFLFGNPMPRDMIYSYTPPLAYIYGLSINLLMFIGFLGIYCELKMLGRTCLIVRLVSLTLLSATMYALWFSFLPYSYWLPFVIVLIPPSFTSVTLYGGYLLLKSLKQDLSQWRKKVGTIFIPGAAACLLIVSALALLTPRTQEYSKELKIYEDSVSLSSFDNKTIEIFMDAGERRAFDIIWVYINYSGEAPFKLEVLNKYGPENKSVSLGIFNFPWTVNWPPEPWIKPVEEQSFYLTLIFSNLSERLVGLNVKIGARSWNNYISSPFWIHGTALLVLGFGTIVSSIRRDMQAKPV